MSPVVILEGPEILWPPNHKMTNYMVDYHLLYPAGEATVSVIGIRQDEVVKVNNGDPSPDGIIGVEGNPDWLQLRAERLGRGNGRVYTIYYMVEYACGGIYMDVFKVQCPHSINGTAIDDGPLYDSTEDLELPKKGR